MKTNALALIKVEILAKRKANFSCTKRATKGSSCFELRKIDFTEQDCNE